MGNPWEIIRDMLHTAARELRSSIPATGRAPCHTIALYSVGCVRNMLTHASPKPTESSSRKAAESEGPPTETLPAGGIPGGAVVPHTRISTSRSATCFLVHRQPYNESKPSLFSKRDQGIFRAHEKSRVSGSDNVVSNGDGFRSGLPIQRSVNTRWSRHPRYHANA